MARGLPVVYVYSQVESPDTVCLLPDDRGGAALAVTHSRARPQAHRSYHRAGAFRGRALREAGYRDALAQAGLMAQADECLAGDWSEAWGREAARRLFGRRGAPPDALFCGNDQIARGAIDALRELGLAVPADVAVVGFDNWEVMAKGARPPLTSVDMNLDALGRAAGECLLEMMSGGALAGVRRLPCSLVVENRAARTRGEASWGN